MESSTWRVFVVLNIVLQYEGSNGLSIAAQPPPIYPNHTVPFASMTTCEMIRYYGYDCEIHEVTTQDGYILELHRIPHGINQPKNTTGKEVALLQHGLIDSSFTWVANAPNESLAYILADKGYDVWLGNSRGNTYSRKHVHLTTEDKKFWDFSFDEFALRDNPAAIDYVLKLTGQKQMNYIGHSQGTMIGFAGFSKLPALGRKIKLFIALAPVTHVKYVKGLMDVISHGTWIAKKVLKALGTKNFLPNSWVLKICADIICRGVTSKLCGGVVFLICGYDASNLELDRLPVYLAHTPAGTSVKDILHFAQIHDNDKFQMYDYGWNGNMHKYLQPFPPPYEVHKMKVPVALFVGANDWLATPTDININLRNHLPNLVYDLDIDDWNHMDFVWGQHANELVYKDVVDLMQGKLP